MAMWIAFGVGLVAIVLIIWLRAGLAHFADSFVRHVDFLVLRTRKGCLRCCNNLRGHSVSCLVSYLGLLCLVLGIGADWYTPRGWVVPAITAAVLLLIVFIYSWLKPQIWSGHPLIVQCLLLVALALLSYLFPTVLGGPEHGRGGDRYWQCLFAGGAILLFLALVSYGLAWFIFDGPGGKRRKKLRQDLKLKNCLHNCDLFVSPDYPAPTIIGLFRSFLVTPLYEPGMLLFLPGLTLALGSLWAMIFRPFVLPWWGWPSIWLAVGWLLLSLASVVRRLDVVLDVFRRLLFGGVLSLLSWLVILLGVARMADFKYVNIVLEGDPILIAVFLFAAYFALWLYEYWINRFLNERLLDLVRSKPAANCADARSYVKYDTDEDIVTTSVAHKPRFLQIHAGARFVSVGRKNGVHDDPAGEDECRQFQGSELIIGTLFGWKIKDNRWQFYDRTTLFRTLVRRSDEARAIEAIAKSMATAGTPGKAAGTTGGNEIADEARDDSGAAETPPGDPDEKQIKETYKQLARDHVRTDDRLHAFESSVVAYLLILRALVPVGVGLLIWWACCAENDAVVVADHQMDDQRREQLYQEKRLYDLRAAMFEADEDHQPPREKVVLVAASGGGTRAALHAASVLHGLQRTGRFDDIVLVSGVSGGSLALAYFAVHHDALSGPRGAAATKTAWGEFRQTMEANYIHDVLQGGAGEFRVLGGRVPLGKLLAESFDRNFSFTQKTHQALSANARYTFGDGRLGIILNATLTGSSPFEYPEKDEQGLVRDDDKKEKWRPELASAYSSGARLIFANVGREKTFPTSGFPEAPNEYLRYVVVQDPSVELTAAAACSANFPPVFPNAAVDLQDVGQRHWITDGGTTENRGIISLLYALSDVLDEQYEHLQQHPTPKGKPKPKLPEIHIVVAEASGAYLDYSHDRGTGALIMAKSKVGSQLMLELYEEVRRRYDKLTDKMQVPATGSIFVHYLQMPSVLRMRSGLGTHWMLPAWATFVDVKPHDQDVAKRDKATLRGTSVSAIMFDLHRTDDQQTPARAEREQAAVDKVWKWINDDPWADPKTKYPAIWKAAREKLEGKVVYD